VPQLRRAINSGNTLRSLRLLLEGIPAKLEDLFNDILRRIGAEYLHDTLRMIQLVVLATRPLDLEEFRHAYAFGPDTPHRKLSDWEHSVDFIEEGEQVTQLIQSRTGGLLEVSAGITYKRREEDDVYQRMEDYRNHRKAADEQSRQNRRLAVSPPPSHNATKRIKHGGNSQPPFLQEDGIRDDAQVQPTWNTTTIPLIESNEFEDYDKSERSYPTSMYEGNPRYQRPQLVVRLIHETAKHFFLKGNGFDQLSSYLEQSQKIPTRGVDFYRCQSGSYLIDGHDFVARSCLVYLELKELRTSIPSLFQSSTTLGDHSRFHFAKYAIQNWLYHAGKADEGGICQQHLLGPLIRWSRTSLDIFVFWASDNNIVSWVELLKGLDANFDTPELSYGRPIRTAVEKGYMKMVTALIDCGANVNGTTGGPETTLRMAFRAGNDEMVKLLEQRGGKMEQMHWLPPSRQHVRL
jgi:hypothetical protein